MLSLKFEPKRFLNHKLSAAEYAAMADVELRDHFAYGGGRRICPGLHVAEQSLFVNISRLLWGFNLEHAKDADGNDIPVDATTMGLSPGFLSIPRPFQCCRAPNCLRLTSLAITPRSARHAKILKDEWEEAKQTGIQFERTHLERLVPQ